MKRLWFKRKWYGWGWYPASWEGWAVTAAYAALLILFALTIDERSGPKEVAFTFLLPAAILTVSFIRICYRTGEKPRWQWGRPDEE